jgi:MscS family membrane protein
LRRGGELISGLLIKALHLRYTWGLYAAAVFPLLFMYCLVAWPQAVAPKGGSVETPARPQDTLGRDTPRGAVLGFIRASRENNTELAALYLNTPLRGTNAADLARQLALVLDRRLPAQLNAISERPEGSLRDPLRPNEDVIGTIKTARGDLDIRLERVDRGTTGTVWLFSRATLASIPDVAKELETPAIEKFFPQFLVTTRLARIPLVEWLLLLIGIPLFYLLTGLLNRLAGVMMGVLRRRRGANEIQNTQFQFLPPPIRLLILALVIRWLASRLALPLLARQFWSTMTVMIGAVATIWLLMSLNGWGEQQLLRRGHVLSRSAPILRFIRRVIDGLMLFSGLLFVLEYFSVDVTTVLAGLGVGGIAVALAAQRTLENVIAGISLIADQALQVGDVVNLGDIQGTVEGVGLRSTRIRTLDRSVASLPNGQVANLRIETISSRDRFWFHPLLSLRYETTPAQLRSVIAGIRSVLTGRTDIDPASVRVRLLRFGTYSLDVDMSAYAFAPDWNEFLMIQEELLLKIMSIVHDAGARFAFPSQTLYFDADESGKLTPDRIRQGISAKTEIMR